MRHGVLKKFAAVAGLLCCGFVATAQPDSMGFLKSWQKPCFHAIANVSLLAGESGRALHLQAIPGLQYKTWFAGIGAGLDYYYLRSVPLFIDVRKQFQKSIPLYAYADAGYNIPWIKESERNTEWYRFDFKSGFYYDVGAGWQYQIGKRNKLLFAVGYAGKRLREKQTFLLDSSITRLRYDLRRLSVKVGFQF